MSSEDFPKAVGKLTLKLSGRSDQLTLKRYNGYAKLDTHTGSRRNPKDCAESSSGDGIECTAGISINSYAGIDLGTGLSCKKLCRAYEDAELEALAGAVFECAGDGARRYARGDFCERKVAAT